MPDDRLSRRSACWVVLYGATLLLVDLGPGWVLTFHESYFAVPAREFLTGGNWLTPRFLGIPQWDKPPLTHWAIALSMAAFRSEAEWVVRFPIAVATIANAYLIAILAARWLGDRIGRMAGLVQLTTVYGLIQSRLAESDMLLAMTVSAAMAAMAIGVVDRPAGSRRPRWLAIAYFAAAGLGFLAKGPVALAFIGGAGGAYALWARSRRAWRFLLDPIGWALMLALVLGWLFAAYSTDPNILYALRENNLDRFVKGRVGDLNPAGLAAEVDGVENPFYYLYTIPFLLLPWTPWAASVAVRGVRDRARPTEFTRLLACWFAVGLALLSVSAFKHKHYAIPILPPLSVLAAVGLTRHIHGPRPGPRAASSVAAMALAIGGAVGVGAGLATAGPASLVPAISLLVLIGGVGIGLASHFRRVGRPGRAPLALFGAIWLCVLLVRSVVLPRFDLYRDQAALARRANDRLPPGVPIYMVGSHFSQVIYYLRPPLVRHDDWRDFAGVVTGAPADSPLYAIAPEEVLAGLRSVGEVRVLDHSPTFNRMQVLEIRRRPGPVAAVPRTTR